MNKKEIFKQLSIEIAQELASITSAAQSTYDIATHEDNKPENKYDTRGLEASYLAGAQAQRVADMKEVLAIFENLPLRQFDENTPIGFTALVEIESGDKKSFVLLMPKGGGQTTHYNTVQIQVVTTESPLGKSLLNQKCGDVIEIENGKSRREYEIISVC